MRKRPVTERGSNKKAPACAGAWCRWCRPSLFVCLFLRLCLDLRLDHGVPFGDGIADGRDADIGAVEADVVVALDDVAFALAQIGRASCRERV